MQVAVKALSVNFAAIYKHLEKKTNSSVISMHFVLIRQFTGFSLKNRSLLKNLRGVHYFTKAQILSLTDTGTYISRNTNHAEYYYILRRKLFLFFSICYYCILWQELLHFVLLLHFVA